MGVSISGVSIPKRHKGSEDSNQTYVLDGFERSLPKKEVTYHEFEIDSYVADGPSLSYSGYNELRRHMAEAFLNTSIDNVWDRCSKLPKRKRYGRNLYHILNFADNEGYIGPTAVKKMAKSLTTSKLLQATVYFQNNAPSYLPYMKELVDCIMQTAADENGYLLFS